MKVKFWVAFWREFLFKWLKKQQKPGLKRDAPTQAASRLFHAHRNKQRGALRQQN